MAINPAFLGYGVWLELSPLKGLKRYANYGKPLPPNPSTVDLVDKFIQALTDMKMSSVWFELFTRTGIIDKDGKQGTRELVDGLRAANIAAVPWGYCFGKNSEHTNPDDNDLYLIKALCDKYKIGIFCADIEPWNKVHGTYDEWDAVALDNLITGLNTHLKKENLGISSFANLNSQPKAREYLTPVTPLVSFCSPQIYWNARDPVTWAKTSLQSWRDAGIQTELIATTQSYWAKDDDTPAREQMEAKLSDFANKFPDSEYAKIAALNWYHAGGPNNIEEGGMSQPMIDTLVAKRLDQKPYKKPYPPGEPAAIV